MRTTSLALVLVAALIGCSSQPATRAVSGQLRVDTSTMNHPVVIAQSSDHRVFIASVTASGRFTLQLPANVSYRMTLASATRTPGIYHAAARIHWPLQSGAARWARLGNGGAINLGAVYQRGSKPSGGGIGISCDSCNGGGGSGGGGGASGGSDDDQGECHEDDQAGCQHGNDGDDDCDHQVGDGDQCDHDDDGDQHDRECDDDDHHKCSSDGGQDDHGDDDHGGGGHACDGGAAGGGGAGGGGGGGAGGGGGGGIK